MAVFNIFNIFLYTNIAFISLDNIVHKALGGPGDLKHLGERANTELVAWWLASRVRDPDSTAESFSAKLKDPLAGDWASVNSIG